MKPPSEERPSDNDEPTPKPSRVEEARRAIEDYANGLRGVIKKLRGQLH